MSAHVYAAFTPGEDGFVKDKYGEQAWIAYDKYRKADAEMTERVDLFWEAVVESTIWILNLMYVAGMMAQGGDSSYASTAWFAATINDDCQSLNPPSNTVKAQYVQLGTAAAVILGANAGTRLFTQFYSTYLFMGIDKLKALTIPQHITLFGLVLLAAVDPWVTAKITDVLFENDMRDSTTFSPWHTYRSTLLFETVLLGFTLSQLGVMIAYGVISDQFASFSFTWIATLVASSQRIYDQLATVFVMLFTWRKVKVIQDEWEASTRGGGGNLAAIKP